MKAVQAAALVGLNPNWLGQRVRDGRLIARKVKRKKVGGRIWAYVFRKEDLEDYNEARLIKKALLKEIILESLRKLGGSGQTHEIHSYVKKDFGKVSSRHVIRNLRALEKLGKVQHRSYCHGDSSSDWVIVGRSSRRTKIDFEQSEWDEE